MTPEEALKDIIEDGINLGAGDYVDLEALKVAAEALKKQVPTKVGKIIIHNTSLIGKPVEVSLYCPKCKRIIESVHDYCWHCGQRLGWEV